MLLIWFSRSSINAYTLELENKSTKHFIGYICAFIYNFFLVLDIALIRWILVQAKQILFVGQILKAKTAGPFGSILEVLECVF